MSNSHRSPQEESFSEYELNAETAFEFVQPWPSCWAWLI